MPKLGEKYSKSEDVFITKNYGLLSDTEMANQLGRPVSSIASRRCKINIYRLREQRNMNRHTVRMVARMKVLIFICENTSNRPKKDEAVKELRRLSRV